MWNDVYGSGPGNMEGIEENSYAPGKREPIHHGVSVRYVVTQVVTSIFLMLELFSFQILDEYKVPR
jgi:hypothetical protein